MRGGGEVAEEEGGAEKESRGGGKENEGGGKENEGGGRENRGVPEGTATEKDPERKGRRKGERLDPDLVKDFFSSKDDDKMADEDHNPNPPKSKVKPKPKTKPLGSSAALNSLLMSIGGPRAAAASSAGQMLEPFQEMSAAEKLVGMVKNENGEGQGKFERTGTLNNSIKNDNLDQAEKKKKKEKKESDESVLFSYGLFFCYVLHVKHLSPFFYFFPLRFFFCRIC
uniref:Uncharacterized protein n=1 Tax=Chromera velia CCMP2878 TaxID=1169474 RepID=A0A0G4HU95_9ALVE|eukprot:Cvel_8616.t1-p1 / transcript=Cvel_8616.t1 / gene=Cvel_8616 / organism=Chromera_velia_CCMP2878 / gene_product=hypothetical protein / transcript_product=hypothetical protein / location=Cvel_scaffold479:74466-80697(-) / protein_length=225 / sequence_SO=supercontig / SO=protein_coding / is_pseudo=false